jgi:hypothetical protein
MTLKEVNCEHAREVSNRDSSLDLAQKSTASRREPVSDLKALRETKIFELAHGNPIEPPSSVARQIGEEPRAGWIAGRSGCPLRDCSDARLLDAYDGDHSHRGSER